MSNMNIRKFLVIATRGQYDWFLRYCIKSGVIDFPADLTVAAKGYDNVMIKGFPLVYCNPPKNVFKQYQRIDIRKVKNNFSLWVKTIYSKVKKDK